jgi:hypothetical protein
MPMETAEHIYTGFKNDYKQIIAKPPFMEKDVK